MRCLTLQIADTVQVSCYTCYLYKRSAQSLNLQCLLRCNRTIARRVRVQNMTKQALQILNTCAFSVRCEHWID